MTCRSPACPRDRASNSPPHRPPPRAPSGLGAVKSWGEEGPATPDPFSPVRRGWVADAPTIDEHPRMDRTSFVLEVAPAATLRSPARSEVTGDAHFGTRPYRTGWGRLGRSALAVAGLATLVIGSAAAAPQESPTSCTSGNCLDAITNPSPYDPTHPQWWRYVPSETTIVPHPMQHLAVFLPTGTAPPTGWPVVMHSNASNFREPIAWCDGTRGAFTKICDDFNIDLMNLIQNGWAVVSVSTVGVDSTISGQEANVFFPEGSPEWEDFNLFWGEKDFTWARQWVAESATTLNLDNDRVVVWGTSSGSIYSGWIALGPTRTFATATSSQALQDTKCAGLVGNLPLAWLPAYDDNFAATHWPDVNGLAAAKVLDAAPGVLAAASPSTWIRAAGSHAVDTPVCILGDEVVHTYTFNRDAQGDPTLTNTFDPPAGPLHPSWFVLTMAEDLMGLDPSFHGIESLFLLSDLTTDLGSVGAPHAGYVDLVYGGTIHNNDAQLLRGHWLRKFTDRVTADAVARNGTGINALCYTTLDVPVVGDTWSVDLDFTAQGGSGIWGIYGYTAPFTFLLPLGQELLLDPTSAFLFSASGLGVGTITPVDFVLPADPGLMGLTLSTQAYTVGPTAGLLLCNAIDLLLGY